MLKNLLCLILIGAFACMPNLVSAQSRQKISLLLHNGKVFTADENYSMAEAVAVDGEKIVAIGNRQRICRAKYQAAQANP
jgi:hypothetical protein